MFSAEERDRLRTRLLEAARDDGRITAGALTGSASVGREDRWSDVDLAFGLAADASLNAVLDDFTASMYREHDAVHHMDLTADGTVYRVFLLRNTLQVDLAFSPPSRYKAVGPTFKTVFGNRPETVDSPRPALEHWIGWAWLYALHTRSCIRREQWWRAEYMLSGLRDTMLTLACARRDLPLDQARGFDMLPEYVARPLEEALVRELRRPELVRAFGAAMRVLLRETADVDAALHKRLEGPLRSLVASVL